MPSQLAAESGDEDKPIRSRPHGTLPMGLRHLRAARSCPFPHTSRILSTIRRIKFAHVRTWTLPVVTSTVLSERHGLPRRRLRAAGRREGPRRQLHLRQEARRQAGAPRRLPLRPQAPRRRGGQVRRQERLLRPRRHRQHHRAVGPLRLRRALALQPASEQVLRDVRGAVHQEGPAAQVPAAGRRIPAGLRQRVGVAGPPADQEGAAAAAGAGPARQDLSSVAPPILLHSPTSFACTASSDHHHGSLPVILLIFDRCLFLSMLILYSGIYN